VNIEKEVGQVPLGETMDRKINCEKQSGEQPFIPGLPKKTGKKLIKL
jgi:hypothetical protein